MERKSKSCEASGVASLSESLRLRGVMLWGGTWWRTREPGMCGECGS